MKHDTAARNMESRVCRGAISLGTACGECQRCKAAAWDWLHEHTHALEYWARTVVPQQMPDPMKAVIQEATKRQPECRSKSEARRVHAMRSPDASECSGLAEQQRRALIELVSTDLVEKTE